MSLWNWLAMSNIYGRLRVCYSKLHQSKGSNVRCTFLENQLFTVHFHSQDYDELIYQIPQPVSLQSALKVSLMSQEHIEVQQTQLQLKDFFKEKFSSQLTPHIRLQFRCRLIFQLGTLTFKSPQKDSFFVQVQMPNQIYYSRCLKSHYDSSSISFQGRRTFETSQKEFPITLRLFRVREEEGKMQQQKKVWVKEVRKYVKETVALGEFSLSFLILNLQDDNCFAQ